MNPVISLAEEPILLWGDEDMNLQLLRLGAVCQLTGLGRSTVYRLIGEGSFPEPIRLSRRAVAWRAVDLHTWMSASERIWAPLGGRPRQ